MGTTTDLNITTDRPYDNNISSTTSIICGTVILVISVTGLIVYLLFVIIALGRKKFQRNSYFTMAGWLGIADCICLVLMITYAAPCVILQKNISNLKFIGGMLNIGWFSGLPLIVFLAANRFFCICHTECFKTLFTTRKTKYYCLSALVFGIAYSVPSFMKYCPLYFNKDTMSWKWNTDHTVAKYITFGEITIVMVVTLATHCLNILVFKEIHSVHKNTTSLHSVNQRRNASRERKTFIQFFVTTLWLPIFDISFISFCYMPDPSPWLGYFVTITYTLNCSVNGWVYVVMNQTIRRAIKQMLPLMSLYRISKSDFSSAEDANEETGAIFNIKYETSNTRKSPICIRTEHQTEAAYMLEEGRNDFDTSNSSIL